MTHLKYLYIADTVNLPIIEIEDIDEYMELIKIYDPKIIFVKTMEKHKKDRNYYRTSNDSISKSGYFLFYKGGVGFRIRNKNYNNIPDMIQGLSKGFSDGNEYYDAKSRGFINYKEYKKAISLGYKTRDDYLQSKDLGFRGILDEIKNIELNRYEEYDDLYEYIYKIRNLLNKFKQEADVYYYSKENGFTDFNEFKDGLSKLFLTGTEYHEALAKGFSNGVEFRKAKDMGFENPVEFHNALKLKIKSKKEYDTYLNLEDIKKEYGLNTMEEALLFKILLALKPKKKLSAEKIWEKLESEKRKFELGNDWYGKRLPKWFDRLFKDKESFKKYLSTSKKINQIGFYDIEGEVFERKTDSQPRKIIIDGSNVAWGGGSKELGDKPHAKNIKLVVDALREKGYSNILVIIDPSLNHQVDDGNILLELEKEKILQKAPAKRDADEFILKYVKEYEAYVITNDTFKDWKETDDWVKKNIETYRVSFMIDGDIVKFDKKIENIGE